MRTDGRLAGPRRAEQPAGGDGTASDCKENLAILGYCGICKEWYAYVTEETVPRCPLCGYRAGDC
jgi:hypothetical protein